MNAAPLYEERVRSNKTQALFMVLAAGCSWLVGRRMVTGRRRGWATAGLGLGAAVFSFYALNFRTLVIRLTPDALTLKFGVFHWREPLDNLTTCRLDELPPLLWYGGAGIHFMSVRQRYRVSFNFLEHARVVIGLRHPAGPVRDLSFSTQQPELVCRLIETAAAVRHHA